MWDASKGPGSVSPTQLQGLLLQLHLLYPKGLCLVSVKTVKRMHILKGLIQDETEILLAFLRVWSRFVVTALSQTSGTLTRGKTQLFGCPWVVTLPSCPSVCPSVRGRQDNLLLGEGQTFFVLFLAICSLLVASLVSLSSCAQRQREKMPMPRSTKTVGSKQPRPGKAVPAVENGRSEKVSLWDSSSLSLQLYAQPLQTYSCVHTE